MESSPAVLIVDDDRVALDTLQDQLSCASYRVVAISDAAEALQRLRLERFGIILADQFLPETPGLEFLRACRETQPLSSRIIVARTASEPVIEEAIVRGDAFRVLLKPWTHFDLTLALIQATDRYRLMEQCEVAARETNRQKNDLAALARRLEIYRERGFSGKAQPSPSPATVELEEIFGQIISRGDQAVWVSDAESHRILYLSPLHEQIWGRPLKELSENQDSWSKTIHPDDLERVMKAALHQTDGTYDQQYRILRPDGEVRWIRDRAFPIADTQQKPPRIAGMVEDITDRKNASDQLETGLQERTEELAWTNLALESERSERRSAEVRLRETNLRLQKALEELRATQGYLAGQERRLDSGRAAGGAVTNVNHEEIRILDTVDTLASLTEVISMAQSRWSDEALRQGRHIAVGQELDPLHPIACAGGEFREMIADLLFNAAEALPQGGSIVVRAYSDVGNAVFEIQDDGIGMTEEIRARCLEPLVTTKGGLGNGLGLARVYGIVYRHHGSIEIESKLGEGSLVRVRLPFCHLPTRKTQRCRSDGIE